MKKIALVLAVTMIFGFLTACSGNTSSTTTGSATPAETTAAPAKIPELSIACNQPGQSWVLIGNSMSEYLKGTMELVVVPGSTYGNILTTNTRDTDFGITASTSLGSAKNGVRYYTEHGKQENVTFVASIYKHHLRGFTTNPDIKVWSDIKGHSVCYGPPGGEGFDYNPLLYSYMGFSDADVELKTMPFADAVEQMKNKQLDAILNCTPTPYAIFDDLVYSDPNNAHLIQMDKETAERLKSEWEGFNYDDYSTIPGNIWAFEEPLYAPYQLITFIANKDVSDEDVYNFTQCIYDNFEALEGIVPAFQGIEEGKDGMIHNVAGLPVHPGAEKFWTEKGLTVVNE